MDTDTTGELGVSITRTTVLKSLHWAFRPQLGSDEGIDAQVEVREAGKTTGRLLALQIKAGKSHFKTLKSGDFAFYFDERLARLWLGYAIPVIVVLVDVESEVAYWQRIGRETVEKTPKKYRVVVPRAQLVSEAHDPWSHMASGLEERAEARYEFAIQLLPPSARALIETLRRDAPNDAAVLALHLSDGRTQPSAIVDTLLTAQPHWLQAPDGLGWRALAAYALEHDLYRQNADALGEAAHLSSNGRARLLAAAGLNVMAVDRARSKAYISEAAALGGAELMVQVAEALLNHPEGDGGPRRLDPPLDIEAAEVLDSVAAQSFLADQARRGNDLSRAGKHANRVLDLDPENSDAMAALADILVRNAFGVEGALDDIRKAASLLQNALEQRRKWSGPTGALLSALLKTLGLLGDFDGVLRYALPEPVGTASATEALRPEVLRHAVDAASLLGREATAQELAEQLDDSPRSQLTRLRAGTMTRSAEETANLWDEVLSQAIERDDFQEAAIAVFSLGRLGRDRTGLIADLVSRGIVPKRMSDLASALAGAASNLDAALPKLRQLARTDPSAAEQLISLLDESERYGSAVDAARNGYTSFRQPYFLILQAELLIKAGDLEAADRASLNAIGAATEMFPRQVGKLLTYLAGRSAEAGEWADAEDYLHRVIRLNPVPRAGDVWRLVTAQLENGQATRAAKAIREYSPEVRSTDDAKLWLQSMVAVPWDEATATEALSLGLRFSTDPQLAAAFIIQIIQSTKGDEPDDDEEVPGGDAVSDNRARVPGDLHRQAFELLDQLTEEHGDATGITRFQGTTDEQIAQMSELLKRQDPPEYREMLVQVQQGRLPLGFAATARRKSYALALVQRSLGPLLAASPDDDEHELEMSVALGSLNGSVVVDLSALSLTAQMTAGSSLRGRFEHLLISSSARRDALRAAVEVQELGASPGTLNWDHDAGRLRFNELSATEYAGLVARAEALEGSAASADIRHANEPALFVDLKNQELHASWLTPLEIAHSQKVPLWSDDIGQRRLARSVGVSAFGTPALTDALADREIEESDGSVAAIDAAVERRSSQVREYVREWVVDVPAHLEDLIAQGEKDDWRPWSAALLLSRPSWWAWQSNAVADWRAVASHVSRRQPGALSAWTRAAMLGAKDAYVDPTFASCMLAVIALIAAATDEPNVEVAVEGLRDAVEIAKGKELPDTLTQVPLAARALAQINILETPDEFSADVLSEFEKSRSVANTDDSDDA